MSNPNEYSTFDSHCHLDRVFARAFKQPTSAFYNGRYQPLDVLKNAYPTAFSNAFEGCINVICHPEHFPTKVWDSLNEPQVYLTLGCHPENSKLYDLSSEFELMKALDHPKVVALGEIGLDDVWENRGISLELQKQVCVF